MKTSRLLFPTLVAVLLGGVAHAGEFSLGGAHMLAQNTAQAGDVAVTFTDRGRSLRETAEGGDTTVRNARALRGTDDVASSAAHDDRPVSAAPAAKATEPAPAATESHGGVSISPAAALRRPSYRWQSLVPGTIK